MTEINLLNVEMLNVTRNLFRNMKNGEIFCLKINSSSRNGIYTLFHHPQEVRDGSFSRRSEEITTFVQQGMGYIAVPLFALISRYLHIFYSWYITFVQLSYCKITLESRMKRLFSPTSVRYRWYHPGSRAWQGKGILRVYWLLYNNYLPWKKSFRKNFKSLEKLVLLILRVTFSFPNIGKRVKWGYRKSISFAGFILMGNLVVGLFVFYFIFIGIVYCVVNTLR